jgi:peroxiredoxin Q/BCP
VRAALVLILAAACVRTPRRADYDPYRSVGLRPDNAARATPPADLEQTALAVGAAAPAVKAALGDHDLTVVVFYRGDWDEHDRTLLRDLRAHAAELAQRKAAVVAISVDSPETSEHLALGEQLAFPLVSDPGHRVIETYGVFDGEPELAWPSIFVVDREAKIRWRWLAPSAAQRITTTEVLAALDRLAP